MVYKILFYFLGDPSYSIQLNQYKKNNHYIASLELDISQILFECDINMTLSFFLALLIVSLLNISAGVPVRYKF